MCLQFFDTLYQNWLARHLVQSEILDDVSQVDALQSKVFGADGQDVGTLKKLN